MRILIFIFTIVVFNLNGQVTFNLRQNFNFPAAVLTSIIPTDSCFYASGIIADSVFPYQTGNIFVRLNLAGEPEMIKTITNAQKTYETWFDDLMMVENSEFINIGYSYDSTGMKGILFKYNKDGDTLFTKEYLNPYFPIHQFIRPAALVEIESGGYVFACWIRSSNLPDADIWLVRIDETGDIIWQKQFGDNWADIPKSILVDPSENLIIGSLKANFNLTPQGIVYRSYLFQTDSLGNHQWTYLSPDSVNREGPFEMVLLDDGSIIAASAVGYEQMNPSVNSMWVQKLVYKLNPAHELEWELEFQEPEMWLETYASNIVEISDGSGFLVAGHSVTDLPGLYSIVVSGWLAKVSHEGDSLWSRNYVYIENEYNSHLINDLAECPDGGFVICGQAFDYLADSLRQQAWLMKVDEYGCLVPGCQLIDQVTEREDTELLLNIYPNPASDYLNFQLRSNQIINQGQFRIIDANGQILSMFPVMRSNDTYILPLFDYPAGVYFLQYLDLESAVVVSEKFVVLH